MRKLLLLFSTLFIICSCSLEGDEPQFHMEFLPAESITYPAYLIPGETYQITVQFVRPTGCYLFDHFNTEQTGDAIFIAVQALVKQDGECKKTENIIGEESFTFTCKDDFNEDDTYIFKFYTGLDENGKKKYFELKYELH